MLTEERRQKILDILKTRNSVSINELESVFSVSNETLRRDLLALESKKQLIRVHGGAMSINGGIVSKSFKERHHENIEQKRELSRQAIGFINEGDIISVDAGSTAVIFCELLCESFKRLTVVTNSLMLFNILSKNEGFRLILCSGEYDRENQLFKGGFTVESIKRLHISKAFICPSGISLKSGLTELDEGYIQIQEAFKSVCDKCFIMADSSKFEVAGLYSAIDLHSDLTVITDKGLSDEIYNRYIEADIDIIRGE